MTNPNRSKSQHMQIRNRDQTRFTANLPLVHEMLTKAGALGLTSEQVSRDLSVSRSQAQNLLKSLQDRGIAKLVQLHVDARWSLVEHHEALRADVLAKAEERRMKRYGCRSAYMRDYRRLHAKKCREQDRARRARALLEAGHGAWADKITQVVVSANDAPPLPKLGPASVWELAA